jgi:AbrB family looped-hinge helix DNA binding protein
MSRDEKREILGLSTITYKFQVTIPKKVRDRCKLKEGDTITFIEEENGKVYLGKSTEV